MFITTTCLLQGSSEGMSKFAMKVEELLCTEDPQLHRVLQKTLRKKTDKSGSFRGSQAKSFHHTLKCVLFPHIQKMFVGTQVPC